MSTGDEKSLMEMAREERSDLAEFLSTLRPEDWQAPSLCDGWTVKDVVAHVISYEDLDVIGLITRFAKGRIVRANEVGVEEFATMSADELLAFLHSHLQPRGLTAGFGGMIALVDGTIHHQRHSACARPPPCHTRLSLETNSSARSDQSPPGRWKTHSGVKAAGD
jgi:uncharacterized protein (TIGR03083 family)